METLTIKDIAKICGVGITTVSRAINNHPDINPETKDRVLKTIAEHDFIPNNSARNLKRTESKTIAVLMKGITNPFFQGMIKVFEQVIERRKYHFLLHRVDEEEDEIGVALELEKEKKPCGIIFLGGSAEHAEEKIRMIKAPFVMCTFGLAPRIDQRIYSSVAIDDVKAACEIVTYLCSLGHERIAMVAAKEEDTAVGAMRLKGYQMALMAQGIPFRKELVLYPEKGDDAYSMSSGYKTAKRFLESGQEATAFFVISDNTSFGVCKAIIDAGKSVPEDYSVAGFDGIEMASYYHPSLTTMKQPFEEMAKESIEFLFDLLDGHSENRHSIFSAELEVSQSTQKPRGKI